MSKPWKKRIAAAALTVGTAASSFFVVCLLFDYSADLFAAQQPINTTQESFDRLHFIGQYYAWRTTQPIVQAVTLSLILSLPLVIFELIRETFSTLLGWERATTLRHAVNLMQCGLLLLGVLPMAINHKVPTQQMLVDSCSPTLIRFPVGPVDENLLGNLMACAVESARMRGINFWMLILNLTFSLCKLLQFVGTAPPEVASEGKRKDE